jgi:feruloyl esterase
MKSFLTGLLIVLAAAARLSVAAPVDCGKLKTLKFGDDKTAVRLTVVEEVTPNPIWVYPPSLFTAMAERQAGGPVGTQKTFCRAVGIIEKEINFEVWLPKEWNGKFQGVGNGGLTGAINYPSMGAALDQGYATASTDTGHRTEQGFFEDEWLEGHPERLTNFAYRAHHLLAVTGKKIAAAFYGKPAEHAYYSGCSSGGWEGLSEAERYPEDYDGIVAGAPAINFVQVQARGVLVAQMMAKNPEGALTHELGQKLAEAAVAKCDALDGVKDGVIDDPRKCTFDPAELQCKSDTSKDCLSEAQVRTARALYGPMKSAGGMKLYPGAAWGASPLAELPPSASGKADPGHAAITLMMPQKPSWTTNTFNPDRDIPVLQKQLGATLNATNPDLHRFQARGGKLIMYHGWADPLLSPYNTLDYYSSVVKTMGGQQSTDAFLRLFMVPGMEHCRGGPGPDTFDAVASLDDWVEHGTPPERIIAAHQGDGKKVDRTRPLCRYPQVAKHKGSGSTDEAANFNCQT